MFGISASVPVMQLSSIEGISVWTVRRSRYRKRRVTQDPRFENALRADERDSDVVENEPLGQ